jgi:uncharacterized protein (TIGR02246 family)
MKIYATALLLAVLTTAAQESVEEEIRRLNRSMMDAWKRNDAAAIAAHYADDARIIGPSGSTVEGRTNIDQYWRRFPTQSRTWTLDVVEVGGTRDLAYQYGRSTISGGARQQTADFIGIWKRQPDGTLKLAIDYWTPASAQTSVSAVEQVRALDAGWARSYAVHDTAYAKSLFADSIIVTATNGSVKNKEGELADIRPQSGLVMSYFRTRDVRVDVHGNAAVVSGVAEWSFTFNGQPSTNTRRYTATYVRGEPLGWRMVALHIGRAS